jgi:hypothetical protein
MCVRGGKALLQRRAGLDVVVTDPAGKESFLLSGARPSLHKGAQGLAHDQALTVTVSRAALANRHQPLPGIRTRVSGCMQQLAKDRGQPFNKTVSAVYLLNSQDHLLRASDVLDQKRWQNLRPSINVASNRSPIVPLPWTDKMILPIGLDQPLVLPIKHVRVEITWPSNWATLK